jgi:hypothetical protein
VRSQKQLCALSCLSVCHNSAPTGCIFMKFEIWVFMKICQENSMCIKIWQAILGTLHEDIRTFVAISQWILLKIKNILDTSCGENQNSFHIEKCFTRNHAMYKIMWKNRVQPDRP